MSKSNKVAFIFPGQASQSPGMGKDIYLNSTAARDTIKEIDAALDNKLQDVMFYGSEAELTSTDNAQPAIAAVSIATWKALEEAREFMQMPSMVAGHSLGEYSLLAMTEVLSVEDTIRLVVRRGALMQKACELFPGGMAALIGLKYDVVADVCRQSGVFISNVNTPLQIIISGQQANLAQAIDLARRRGAKKAVPLSVGGAFHSKFMEPAQSELNDFIETLDFNDPLVPIIGNVEAKPLTKAADIKQELKSQLQSCVQWNDSVRYMVGSGVDLFVELGPGKVLSGLVKRIEPEARVLSVCDYNAIGQYLEMA